MKNIKHYCLALGDKRGILKFISLKSDDQNKISDKGELEVNVVPLDSILRGNVDFLKIDTEGYEYLVLKGAAEALKNSKLVFLEFNTKNNTLNGIRSEEIIQLLISFIFALFTVDVLQKNIISFNYEATMDYGVYLLAIKNVSEFIKKTGYNIG